MSVRRNGSDELIESKDVVVGDIISCANSLKIRADGIMISTQDMKTKEADLTGEKDLLQKFPYEMKDDKLGGRPFAFKGTIVTDGEGKMLVCSVGTNTNEGLNQLQSNLKKVK